MRMLYSSALLSCCLSISTSNAFASTVTYSVIGTVSSVFDTTGVYGSDLVGQPFSATGVFDLDKANYGQSSLSVYAYSGGPLISNTPVFGSIKLSFGGFNIDLMGQYSSTISISKDSSVEIQIVQRNDNSGIDYADIRIDSQSVGDGTSSASLPSVTGGGFYDNRLGTDVTVIDFNPLSASTTSDVSAVPLPPALPMFGAALLGLGAVGYSVRRRAGKVAA